MGLLDVTSSMDWFCWEDNMIPGWIEICGIETNNSGDFISPFYGDMMGI